MQRDQPIVLSQSLGTSNQFSRGQDIILHKRSTPNLTVYNVSLICSGFLDTFFIEAFIGHDLRSYNFFF